MEHWLYREQQGRSEALDAMIVLQSDYDDCLAFISFIPNDLHNQLVERYEYLRDMEQQKLK